MRATPRCAERSHRHPAAPSPPVVRRVEGTTAQAQSHAAGHPRVIAAVAVGRVAAAAATKGTVGGRATGTASAAVWHPPHTQMQRALLRKRARVPEAARGDRRRSTDAAVRGCRRRAGSRSARSARSGGAGAAAWVRRRRCGGVGRAARCAASVCGRGHRQAVRVHGSWCAGTAGGVQVWQAACGHGMRCACALFGTGQRAHSRMSPASRPRNSAVATPSRSSRPTRS